MAFSVQAYIPSSGVTAQQRKEIKDSLFNLKRLSPKVLKVIQRPFFPNIPSAQDKSTSTRQTHYGSLQMASEINGHLPESLANDWAELKEANAAEHEEALAKREDQEGSKEESKKTGAKKDKKRETGGVDEGEGEDTQSARHQGYKNTKEIVLECFCVGLGELNKDLNVLRTVKIPSDDQQDAMLSRHEAYHEGPRLKYGERGGVGETLVEVFVEIASWIAATWKPLFSERVRSRTILRCEAFRQEKAAGSRSAQKGDSYISAPVDSTSSCLEEIIELKALDLCGTQGPPAFNQSCLEAQARRATAEAQGVAEKDLPQRQAISLRFDGYKVWPVARYPYIKQANGRIVQHRKDLDQVCQTTEYAWHIRDKKTLVGKGLLTDGRHYWPIQVDGQRSVVKLGTFAAVDDEHAGLTAKIMSSYAKPTCSGRTVEEKKLPVKQNTRVSGRRFMR